MRKFFRKHFHSTALSSVTAAAVVMAFFGVLSRLLGFVRDRMLAASFGAGDTLDVYYAAFRLPDTMFEFLVLGALSAAFIPVFSGLWAKDKSEEAWRLAGGLFVLILISLGLLALMLYFLAPLIVPLMVPGFNQEKTQLTVSFTRVMLLSPVFLGASAVMGGILVSLKRFIVYALAPIFYNLGIIGGILFLVPFLGPIGLAWGVVAGAALHLLVTLPTVVGCGFNRLLSLREAWHNSHVRKVLSLMIPRAFGSAAFQINLLAVTFFASLTAAGSLTVFNFANNIQSVPLGLVAMPFALAVFPVLSARFARGQHHSFAELVAKYLRRILFLVVPLSMLLITLRAQVVRVVLGSGRFDWDDTILTFQTLGILSTSIFAQAGIILLTRSFYARENTRTPVIIALISVAVNIALIWLLLPIWGVYAIAAGFSFAAILNFVLLFIFLEKELCCSALTRIHDSVLRSLLAVGTASLAVFVVARLAGVSIESLDAKFLILLSVLWLTIFVVSAMLLRVDDFFVRMPAATVVAALAVQLSKLVIGTLTDLDTFWEVFLQLTVAGSIGAATYLLMSYLLRIDEFFVLRAKVISSIIRRGGTA